MVTQPFLPADEPIQVEVTSAQKDLKIDKAWFCSLAKFVFEHENVRSANLSVAFVTSAKIHALNRDFLGHDYETDVITFPLEESENGDIVGEIVIGAAYACTEARARQKEPVAEASLYLVHGILHLCGYDDQSAGDRREMMRRQGSLLKQFLVGCPIETYGRRPPKPTARKKRYA